MSPVGWQFLFPYMCFPRVSGDEPVLTMLNDCARLFSPRERG